MRFVRSYLTASLTATIAFLATNAIVVLLQGLGFDALHDFWPMAAIYSLYSLGYTLGLGLLGWMVLRAVHQTSYLAYGLTGLILGFGTIVVSAGFREALGDPFSWMFAFAGVAAALSFRWAYYELPGTGSAPVSRAKA